MPETAERGAKRVDRGVPRLLGAIPIWYPGAWAPPAETLTLASIFAAAAGIAFLMRDATSRALFRLPFDAYFLAAPAALLAGSIAWRGRHRPGIRFDYPRYWALLFTLACTFLAGWGVWDRLRAQRASPQVHAFSAVALMTALVLAPRLLRVYPYSRWVVHIAPVSLVWAAGLCLFGAFAVEQRVIRDETAHVWEGIGGIKDLGSELRFFADYPWAKPRERRDVPKQIQRLKGLLPNKALWDPYFWFEADLLGHREELRHTSSDLIGTALYAFQSPHAPVLSLPRVMADNLDATRWKPHTQFQSTSALAADYYREIGRVFRAIRTGLAQSEARDEVAAAKQEFDQKIDQLTGTLSEQWIAAVATSSQELLTPGNLVSARVADQPIRLGDLGRWKNLPWGGAQSLLGRLGCSAVPADYPRMEVERVPSTTDPTGWTEIEVPYTYRRVECYGYRPNSSNTGAEMAAELHLIYKLGARRGSAMPWRVTLYFELPQDPKYSDDLMQALADLTTESGEPGYENTNGQAPSGGFKVRGPRGFVASPSSIRRDGRTVLQVKVL